MPARRGPQRCHVSERSQIHENSSNDARNNGEMHFAYKRVMMLTVTGTDVQRIGGFTRRDGR